MRTKYRWDPDTRKMIEVPKDYQGPARSDGPFFMSDIQPFVTTDKVEITSRSALRAYERKNNVRQVGNDFNPGNF
ncbi:hypothetical protein [Thalassospira marina]|uniref:Uncharacterized protein n=1 Tax=Thalassospira marina TaxID=2048283 RepID=A0A2N3KXV9_9PROT|nr:hypothetical protein [Thalassospira marina]PKR55409.1 hypothetical protein COO20_04360 [Thalassospira marina]